MPVRTAAMCGALVIDSMPPATTTLAEPALIRSWPSMMAFMPEPQTLLSVVQPVEGGSPAANAACRAGAWPRLAGNTQPISTSPTSPGAMPDCCSAAPMAAAPSLGVGKPVNWPRKAPIGVRLAAAMMMSDMILGLQERHTGRTRPAGEATAAQTKTVHDGLCGVCCAAANPVRAAQRASGQNGAAGGNRWGTGT